MEKSEKLKLTGDKPLRVSCNLASRDPRTIRGGAGYAEYFESEENIILPPGTSVALNSNDKLVVAKEGEQPIGVISTNPFAVGNNYYEWPDKYLYDKSGQVIMEEYEEEIMKPRIRIVTGQRQRFEEQTATGINPSALLKEVDIRNQAGTIIGQHTVPVMEGYQVEELVFDDNGDEVMEHTGKFFKKKCPQLNPDYDPNKKYIPRSERPEWHCVGLFGQVKLLKNQATGLGWRKTKDVSANLEFWFIK